MSISYGGVGVLGPWLSLYPPQLGELADAVFEPYGCKGLDFIVYFCHMKIEAIKHLMR